MQRFAEHSGNPKFLSFFANSRVYKNHELKSKKTKEGPTAPTQRTEKNKTKKRERKKPLHHDIQNNCLITVFQLKLIHLPWQSYYKAFGPIDRFHKWRLINYSFVYVLIRTTILVLKEHFFCTLSVLTRLVSLISAKTIEYFFWPPFMQSVHKLPIKRILTLTRSRYLKFAREKRHTSLSSKTFYKF